MRSSTLALGLGIPVALALTLGITVLACGETTPEASTEPADQAQPEQEAALQGPLPALLMVQAHFKRQNGKPVPQPARLVIWRTDGERWEQEEILDPDSNVFHKAMPWRDGFLTIGAEDAKLKHWTGGQGQWKATTLWEQSWGGKFDRLRDIELGDVDNDGAEEIVLATHDQGVVAVGDEVDGAWTFTELDKTPDIFVHEIEIGDVDGDGKLEFYATPSGRNQASGESQPGQVVRYDFADGAWKRTILANWAESHAKEILVTQVGGKDVLYAVREAHAEKDTDGELKLLDPVRIVQLSPGEGGWTQSVVGTLHPEEKQCRFLVPGDVDGDGQLELVAAGYKTGLYVMELGEDGQWTPTLIDADSGGFEHATHVADMDGDGKLEIYVANDVDKKNERGALRRYLWNGTSFDRSEISEIEALHITWNLQDAKL